MGIGEWCPPSSSRPASLSLYFLSPVQLRRGVTERLWWAPGVQPGSTHHILSHSNSCSTGEFLTWIIPETFLLFSFVIKNTFSPFPSFFLCPGFLPPFQFLPFFRLCLCQRSPNLFSSPKHQGKSPADKKNRGIRSSVALVCKNHMVSSPCRVTPLPHRGDENHWHRSQRSGPQLDDQHCERCHWTLTHINCRKKINHSTAQPRIQKKKEEPTQKSYCPHTKYFELHLNTSLSFMLKKKREEVQRRSFLSITIATHCVIVSHIRHSKNIPFPTPWSLPVFFTGILLALSTVTG